MLQARSNEVLRLTYYALLAHPIKVVFPQWACIITVLDCGRQTLRLGLTGYTRLCVQCREAWKCYRDQERRSRKRQRRLLGF